jgi:FixJ family two-component response regulator
MTGATVFIVDDDPAVRDSLGLLLETAGLAVECHDSAEAFLQTWRPGRPGCLVLDVRMGGMSGPELQAELNRRGSRLPIIFLTAHGDIPMTVRALKTGAADFLTKPVDGTVLLERVQAALHQDCESRAHHGARDAAQQRLASLSPREREILALVLAGHANKVIAQRLDISYRTVELHRSHILQKTGTASMLELAQLATDGGFSVGDRE